MIVGASRQVQLRTGPQVDNLPHSGRRLLAGVDGVAGFLEEFLLEAWGDAVGFDGFDGVDEGGNGGFGFEFAEFAGGGGPVAGVVVGIFGIPPDSGVEALGEVLAVAVGAGLFGGLIHFDEVGAGDEGARGFRFAGVAVVGGFLDGAAGGYGGTEVDVDDIVARLGELGLGEVLKKVSVAAVSVGDDDLLAAVAGHFVHRFLEQVELETRAVGDGAGFVFGFEDLAKVVFGEDDGVLLVGGREGGVAYVDEVGTEREVGAVLFNDAEGQDADPLGLANPLEELRSVEFFPANRQGLGREEGSQQEEQEKSHLLLSVLQGKGYLRERTVPL